MSIAQIKLTKYINKCMLLINNYNYQNGGNSEIKYCKGHENLKHTIDEIKDDYPIVIENYNITKNNETKDKFNIKIVRDDLIPGGTKQRAWRIFEKITENEIVYASKYNGFTQLTLAIIALKINKCATIFLDRNNKTITSIAKEYGVNVIIKKDKDINELYYAAKKYAKMNKSHFMFAGFHEGAIIDEITRDIQNKIIGLLDPMQKYNFWVEGKSGSIIDVLFKLFPNSMINIIELDNKKKKNKIYNDDRIKTHIVSHIITEYVFNDLEVSRPLSEFNVSTYHASIWKYITEFAQDGDIFWNGLPIVDKTHEKDEFEEIDNNTYEYEILKLFKENNLKPKKLLIRYPLKEILKYYANRTITMVDNIKEVLFKIDYDKNFKLLNNITDYFILPVRMSCLVEGKKYTPLELYKKEKRINKGYITYNFLKKLLHNSECTLLYFTRVVLLLKELFGKKSDIKYIDSSAGWGDRLIAALLCGVIEYRAYDPNINLKNGHSKIINYFKKHKLIDYYGLQIDNRIDIKNYNIIYKPFEFDYSDEIDLVDHYDICISSPPFFTYEKYSDELNQSANSYNTEETWLTNFLFPSFKKLIKLLKKGGFICWYIEDKEDYQFLPKFIKYTNEVPNCKYYGKYGFAYSDMAKSRFFDVWQKI
jgi:hypothetical protein